MLPALRAGEAFVLGDSVLMPMRTLVTMPHPTPQSGDVDFFGLWSAPMVETDVDAVISHWRRQDRQRPMDQAEEPVSPQADQAKPAEKPQPPKIPPNRLRIASITGVRR